MPSSFLILVVDDNPHLCAGTQRVLGAHGYETIGTSSGQDALRLTREHHPDLVLLDVNMPDTNGYEVCRIIKADVTLSDVYVALISSLTNDSADQTIGLELGADGFIVRPLSNRDLLARVNSLMRLKNAEKAQKETQERLEAALEALGAGVWDWDINKNKVFFSSLWKTMHGCHDEEITDTVEELKLRIHTDDRDLFETNIQRHLSGQTPFYMNEHRVSCGDGTFKWILDRGKVVKRRPDGTPARMIGAYTDMTLHKYAEQAQNVVYHEIEDLYENAPCGYHSLDSEGLIIRMNSTELSWLGFTKEEVLGKKKISDMLTRDSLDIFNRTFPLVKKSGRLKNLELEMLRKDGSTFPVLVSATAIMGSDGNYFISRSTVIDITERKRMENEIAKSLEKFQTVADFSSDWEYWIDPHGKLIHVSRACKNITGYDRDEFAANPNLIAEIVHPEDRSAVLEHLSSIDPGPPHSCEFRIITRSGDTKWIGHSCQAVHSESGAWLGRRVGNRDVTALKRSIEAMEASESRFRGMFENHNAIMLLIEPRSGRIISANRSAELFYGYSISQLCSMVIQDINMLPDIEIEAERHRAFLEHRNYFVFPHKLANGEIKTVEVHSSPIIQDGETLLFSVIHDITERKLAESRLAELSELNQQIIDSSPVGICIYRSDGQCVVVNQSASRIVGTSRELLLQDNFNAIDSWKETGLLDVALDTLSTGRPNSCSINITTSPGKDLWMSVLFNRITWKGEPHLLSMVTDTTDVKHFEMKLRESNENLEKTVTERTSDLVSANRKLFDEIKEHADTALALRDSEDNLRTIIEWAPIAIFVIRNGVYSFVNQAFMNIFGLDRQSEIIGDSPQIPFDDDSGRLIVELISKCHDSLEMGHASEVRLVDRKKRERCLNLWVLPIEMWGSLSTIGFMVDVSDEVERRSRLNQSQKMEALGSLAGGIAHDFNNILQAIIGYTELALDNTQDGSLQNRQLGEVLKASQRASELVKHILTFSRKTQHDKKQMPLSPILKESLSFIRASVGRNIDIRKNIFPDLHLVNGDSTQIHQIIMNLVTNACHAMKNSGGLLEVTLNDVCVDKSFVKTRPGMHPGTYQKLTVSDTGHGIPPQIIGQIFDPYFTTKEPGQGTGLGLSVVDSIVRDHGGIITVRSAPQKGTTFEVYLPVVMNQENSTCEVERKTPRGSGRILLVDDEVLITDPTKLNLEKLGYIVTTENDPVRALKLFQSQPDSFDLVITDMGMPKMSGIKLSKEMRLIRSDIPIIMATGFTDMLSGDDLRAYGIRKLLEKPLGKSALAQAVNDALEEIAAKKPVS